MQLRRRVEGLETRLIPPARVEVHIVGVMSGETEAEALARYGRPIEESDRLNLILLVGVAPGSVPGSVHEAA